MRERKNILISQYALPRCLWSWSHYPPPPFLLVAAGGSGAGGGGVVGSTGAHVATFDDDIGAIVETLIDFVTVDTKFSFLHVRNNVFLFFFLFLLFLFTFLLSILQSRDCVTRVNASWSRGESKRCHRRLTSKRTFVFKVCFFFFFWIAVLN